MARTITLTLRDDTIRQLDELCAVLGADRDQLITSLVKREYERRTPEMTDPCPWKLTRAAVQQTMAIVGCSREDATELLSTAALDAVRAEREGRRQPRALDSGALCYRGPSPRRLNLIVMPGSPPQLISVGVPGAPRR